MFRCQAIIHTDDRPASLLTDRMAKLVVRIDIANAEPTTMKEQHDGLIGIAVMAFFSRLFAAVGLVAPNCHVVSISIGNSFVFPSNSCQAFLGKRHDSA